MAEVTPIPSDRRRTASSLNLDVHPTVPGQGLLRRTRSLNVQRSHPVLLEINRDVQETPLVALNAIEPNADDLQIRPQRGSFSIIPAQVDCSSRISSPSSARSARNHWPIGKRPSTFERREYPEVIARLSSDFDHLINVREVGGHPAKPVCSFFEGTEADMHGYFSVQVPIKRTWQKMAKSADSIFNPQSENSVRMIFLQDLGVSAINGLGFYLQLNPEFFEEHLNRSGYHEASYQDPLPHTWNTNSAEKDYFSIRWFRPVLRNTEAPPKRSDRTELLREDSIKWDEWDKITPSEGRGRPRWKYVTHRVRSGTNILRQEWNLSADPAAQHVTLDKLVPCCWEERATVYRTAAPGNRRLDERNTRVNDSGRTIPTRGAQWRRAKLSPYDPPSSRLPPPSLGSLSKGGCTGLIFALELSDQLKSLRSTHADLHGWMKHLADQGDESQVDPCVALLNIVSLDTQGLFRFIEAALHEVSISSMNDYLLQERLPHWQTLTNKILIELPLIMSSIEGLVHYYFRGTPVPAQVQDIVDKLRRGTGKLVKMTEKSNMSRRADLAILESKRQIAEAEGVSRLTELGFIFLPLSFAASAFSMQINELENRVPLSTFVVVAVVFAAIAYGIRLLIRNSSVKSIRRTCFSKARAYAKITPESGIPARTFVSWLLTWLWNRTRLSILVIALTLPICVAPLVVFWIRSPFHVSFKVVLTLLIGPPSLALAWVSSSTFITVEEDRQRWVPNFWGYPSGRKWTWPRREREAHGDAPQP